MRLRNATWAEVEAMFHGAGWQAITNAQGWADRYGVPHENYSTLPIMLESWDSDRIAWSLVAMSAVEPRMSVDMHGIVNNATLPPRLDGLPLVAIRFGARLGLLDGKHRAHKWKSAPGNYAVLVIESAHR